MRDGYVMLVHTKRGEDDNVGFLRDLRVLDAVLVSIEHARTTEWWTRKEDLEALSTLRAIRRDQRQYEEQK